MITMYVIYDHPKDYPTKFVVRRWYVKPTQGRINAATFRTMVEIDRGLATSLEEARGLIPQGYVKADLMAFMAYDDPLIVEVWL